MPFRPYDNMNQKVENAIRVLDARKVPQDRVGVIFEGVYYGPGDEIPADVYKRLVRLPLERHG